MDKTIIRLDNIAKSFGNVRVIHHISFSIEAGKVYALAGENGAGKSTLCNIISGSLKPDEGTISYGDKEYSSFTIQQAKEIGIKMVHQELQILPLMNVEENIFIGEESSRRGFVNKKEMRKRSLELLEMVGLNVGAKAEIYKLINELTAQGMAIVLISSELPEVMGMSDRLLIMYEGRVTGQLLKEEYTEERVMEYATGRKVHNE